MIPKKIHYCWFGGNPLPELAQKCIASWKQYCPDYEIIEWNESNFDINCCDYVREAYEAKKWAFVSDYARYKILHEYGGVYFDTDVEVLRPIDDLLAKGAFMGCENQTIKEGLGCAVNPGLGCAVVVGHSFYQEMLEDYEKSSFYNADGSLNLYTVVQRTTDLLRKHELQDTMDVQQVADITIYPAEYFCPKSPKNWSVNITDNTYTIHHFDGSWLADEIKYANEIRAKYNKYLPDIIVKCVSRFYAITKIKGLKYALQEMKKWIAGKNDG